MHTNKCVCVCRCVIIVPYEIIVIKALHYTRNIIGTRVVNINPMPKICITFLF